VCVFVHVHFAGSSDKGTVEVTNCFTVPHNESEDEVRIIFIARSFLGKNWPNFAF